MKNVKIMKNWIRSAAIILLLSFYLTGCATIGTRDTGQLNVPRNLRISVDGRLMTVSWNAVANASGYIIHSTSENCASGNRIVNTATKIATNHTETVTNSDTAETGIRDRGNGFVTFTSDTSLTVWLMADSGYEQTNPDAPPMPTALIVKIMAVGDGVNYRDSGYSSEARLNRARYN